MLQRAPQAPQLLRSDATSMQVPPQSRRPPVHSQRPLLQRWPLGQTLPQNPQLLLSVEVLTHVPLQMVKPALMQRHALPEQA